MSHIVCLKQIKYLAVHLHSAAWMTLGINKRFSERRVIPICMAWHLHWSWRDKNSIP